MTQNRSPLSMCCNDTKPYCLFCYRAPDPTRSLRCVVAVRKRAVDAPAHDYIHFAGRRVQEIDISNLADLLQREQDNKLD